jgi:hypothetical protein
MEKARPCLLSLILLLVLLSCLGCKHYDNQASQTNRETPGIFCENGEEAMQDKNTASKETEEIPKEKALPKIDEVIPDEDALPKTEVNKPEEDTASNDKTETQEENILTEGDKTMSDESRLTKAELLDYIETNDTGLSKDDFADIDINDFLDYARLSKKRLATVNIMNMLEIYKFTLKDREFDQYKAKEIISTYSGDEEYESFKNMFFDRIGIDKQYIGKTASLIEIFYVNINDEIVRIELGKTLNLDKCDIDTSSDGALRINENHSGETYVPKLFCYSKNKKYFMLLPPSLELIEAFCGIND